jgi:L-ascorbate metabolism protein UlaG (beta-lactamase superfamily)
MANPKLKKYLLFSGMVILAILQLVMFGSCASFGRTPRGERLERIKNSPNFRDGVFQNQPLPPDMVPPEPVSPETGRRTPRVFRLLGFAFRDTSGIRPQTDIPAVKTDLNGLSREEEVFVWFGHSSCFIQTGGKRFLIDPVFVRAAPVSFANRPFRGTTLYKPEDMPEIDYLIISHDHWDHLDYDTVRKLKNRIGMVICGLGVGEHFERWGFEKERIIELDWGESAVLDNGIVVECFPARHFSGRGLFNRNTTLWVSYILQTVSKTIFISGDGGYGSHFTEIGRRFETIDLAIMENGQYNSAWSANHLMPAYLVRAISELRPRKLITVHNSKYTLSSHRWDEPLINISAAAERESINLLTPIIGEVVYLDDDSQTFNRWWEALSRED